MIKFVLLAVALTPVATVWGKPLTSNISFEDQRNFGALLSDDFAEIDFSGQASLGNCSGSVVSFGQAESAKAVLLTNGHCIGMMDGDPNQVIVNRSYQRSVQLYKDKKNMIAASVTKILYGLIQPHDIAFLELSDTYSALKAKGVVARIVGEKMAEVGTDIALATGLFNYVSTCQVEAIIYQIKEDVWTNSNSYKYHCRAGHGTSGSPLIDVKTGEVIGVNYTGNDDGERCTMNNPCEVDPAGNVVVEKGAGYGDQVYKIMDCLNEDRLIDLTVSGCLLPNNKYVNP